MLAQANSARGGMTAEAEVFAAKASIMRHAADMRAAAEAHMSAAKATTAKTTVAAATATAVRLSRADSEGRCERGCCQNHDCSFHGNSFRVDLLAINSVRFRVLPSPKGLMARFVMTER
ncbi:hypothetical protein [Bradyrhizobium sp. CCGB20]|uniref:hypothetical protein n=1 Tax=Bradyrhizobium sp. CCGB20 TaxID=2949633 RepID=UPI0020B257B2|nr:hypothetical protein [Bradyrhizobium sp. CCGB20]MCP3398646.1 hypothetical protein [Bradyrhizobium sp. CCGB20]